MSRHESVSSLDGDTFVVSDLRGDIDASPSEPREAVITIWVTLLARAN